MTELDTRNPEFSVGIRGYDRAQVDEYVDDLKRLLADAERSADEIRERAEREHVAMLSEFDSDRRRIRDEVTILERCKAEAIGELNRLRELLGEAAGVVGRATESGGARIPLPTQVISGSDETVELPAIVDDTAAD
jgi:DivIVA domain-containing protein